MTCATRRAKGAMPVRRLAPAEDLGPMHTSHAARHPERTRVRRTWGARGGRERGMNPEPSLDTGLLVGRQNVLPRAQRDAVPAPGVEIEDAFGLGGKRRI